MKTHTLKTSLLLLLLTVAASGRTLQQLQQWNNGYYWDATATTWHQHSNGGCWVQNTASVDALTYCDGTAIVAGHAIVIESELFVQGWVKDYAQVTGGRVDKYGMVANFAVLKNGIVTDHATLTGNGLMDGCGVGCNPAMILSGYANMAGTMLNTAQVSDHAIMLAGTVAKNNARIKDSSVLNGNVTVQDTAQTTGCTLLASFSPDPPIVVSGTTVLYTSCH